jgi:hypothetical protein
VNVVLPEVIGYALKHGLVLSPVDDLTDEDIRAINAYFNNHPETDDAAHANRMRITYVTRSTLKMREEGIPVTIRGQSLDVPEVEGPECPDHATRMEFDATSGLWICTNFQCKKKARPRLTIGNLNASILGGDLSLYVSADDRYFLYTHQGDFLIEVTKYLSKASTGSMHKQAGYHVGLQFSEAHTGKD